MTYVVRSSHGDRLPTKRTRRRRLGWPHATVLLAAIVVATAPIATAQAASSIPLGSDSSFAVLAASAITNTGPTTIIGNVGLDPGLASSITGFTPATVPVGTVYAAGSVSLQAQSDLTTAYTDATTLPTTTVVTGLGGGIPLTPGVYASTSSLGLTGTLTLDAQGNPNAMFVFKAPTTLGAATSSDVVLINGANACNVFWVVGGAATIGASSVFVGTIMAASSITMITGASLTGRALSENGQVTLQSNPITSPTCSTPTAPVVSTTPVGSTTVGSTPVVSTPVASTPSPTDTTAIAIAGGDVTVTLDGGDSTGTPLTYTITSGPSHGTLGAIDQANGTVSYTPRRGFAGLDSFSYEVTTTNGTSSTATVTVRIKASAAMLKARAKAKAEAKAKARAKAKAKAKGPSRPPITQPGFTG